MFSSWRYVGFAIGIIVGLALLAFNFLTSGGATVLHWMGWWG